MENNWRSFPSSIKIDLPTADVTGSSNRSTPSWRWIPSVHLKCLAKEGIGIEEILEAIVTRIPPPKGIRQLHWLP